MCVRLQVVVWSGGLGSAAQGIDALFQGRPTSELFFVMVCCPLLMNAAQIVLQDVVLKARRAVGAARAEGGVVLPQWGEHEQEGLLQRQ